MTLKECYSKMNADYSDVINRLGMEKLVDKFLLKYPDDPTMEELRKAVAAGNIEDSFNAAHTLKGVTANLSLTALMNVAIRLTEQLRPRSAVADPELMKAVEEQYENTINVINEYKASKEGGTVWQS